MIFFYELDPRLAPPTGELLERLRALADNPGFDPGDYVWKRGAAHRAVPHSVCRLCARQYAPDGVCGVCRCQIRKLRQEATRAAG